MTATHCGCRTAGCVFSSDRAGARDLFVKASDATSAVQRLTDGPYSKYATAVSRDGRRVIFTEESPKTNDDIMELELDGARSVTPLVQILVCRAEWGPVAGRPLAGVRGE